MNVLWSGKTFYVDDLVTDTAMRSRGFGEQMIAWLIDLARREGCTTFSLDSGTHREQAHAFYFRQGLRITDFHFSDAALKGCVSVPYAFRAKNRARFIRQETQTT